MELNAEPSAFSDLLGLPVCDRAGRSLGQVFEARAHWEAGSSIVIDELLVGGRSLLRRMRGPGPHVRGIPWEAVAEVRSDRIVVHR
jgi:sporulation protein YlmC with PRC-barrel domain